MINIFKSKGKITFTHNITEITGEYMDTKIVEEVIGKLSDMWVEKYGDELLEQLSPNEVSKAIKSKVSTKIAEGLLK